MHRWLTLLLLIMLPLQFAWTAAAVYCQHEVAQETSAVEGHFGHHEHEHDAVTEAAAAKVQTGDAQTGDAQTGDDYPAEVAKLALDNDCGYCQLSAAKPVLRQPLAVPARASPLMPAVMAQRWQTRDPDRLERPDWRLA